MYKTEGVVLRTKNLGEADKIVTVYSLQNGKIGAIARGARRIRNRLLGPTQIFTHGRYLLFKGKNLDTLSQAEIVQSNQSMRDDLEQMAYASYITELLDLFTEEGEPQPEIFALLLNTLKLGKAGRFNLAVRAFELRLMKHLGYEPLLDCCVECCSRPEKQLLFSVDGGLVCPNCRGNTKREMPLSLGTYQLMKNLLDWDYDRISILHPSANSLAELTGILRAYLDYRLPRPVKSLEFLNSLVKPAEEVKGNG